MLALYYDNSFAGLLSALFDAYESGVFPDLVLRQGDIPPLTALAPRLAVADELKAARVLAGLKKRLSPEGQATVKRVWHADLPECGQLLFRYLRKVFDSPGTIEGDYGDPDVLAVNRLERAVCREVQHMLGFVRFQKSAQNIFFAPIAPKYDSLPLLLDHFADRFGDQAWVMYDMSRHYGVLRQDGEFRPIELDESLVQGFRLRPDLLAGNEHFFQTLWTSYLQAVTIQERVNPRLQASLMPRRYWPFLTEMNARRTASRP